jgi:hypothetical protein
MTEKTPIKESEESSIREESPEVTAILESENPLPLIQAHLDNLIVGEEKTKLTIFLLLLSGKIKEDELKEMILLKSESGAGKSHLQRIANLFNSLWVGRLSKTARSIDLLCTSS